MPVEGYQGRTTNTPSIWSIKPVEVMVKLRRDTFTHTSGAYFGLGSFVVMNSLHCNTSNTTWENIKMMARVYCGCAKET